MSPQSKRLVKIVSGVVGIGLIALASFGAGMFVYANFFAPYPSSSTLATSLPFFSANIQNANYTPLRSEDVPPEFATFWEAWQFLNEEFYGEIPADNERVYGAVRGMVASFGDQHTSFIDPVRAAIMSENIQGSFEGIGATIRLDEAGRLVVADPMPGRPAFEAGLRPDDIILEVDGESIDGLSLQEAVLLIRGPANSTVVLTIFREGELHPFEVPIVRAKIELEVVTSEMLESDIGYVRLTQFSGGASEKLTEAIEALQKQGAESLIFDLRSNPGGLLSEAVNVSSLFIKDGTVVVERLKGGEEKVFHAKSSLNVAGDMPLVVLVNGGSASASEIVSGAMQDLDRATVIGEQTFGKGSVQLPHNLADGSELRVTIAEWLTPAKRQIHKKGITPDVEVEMTIEDMEQERDPQLDKAIEYLNGGQKIE
ncbi:MAG: S41 family peptidase [Anaerolineae bacterium]|nr:S41 family peptidase [Anaerolineae bacterium]